MAGKLGDTYDGRVSAAVRRRVVALFADVGREWPVAWGLIKVPPREGLRHMREDMEEEAAEALVEGEAEAWHRWRRRVKYCAYQLEWLALASGKKPGARYQWLRKLGSALGKVNDMHNLTRWVGGQKSRSNGGKYLREWSREAGDQWAKRARRLAKEGKLV
jgi:CHAD domain-containing protein